MKYDYYKYQTNDETWHLVRVSTDLTLAIALEKAFAEDIINKNGPGRVIPTSKNTYGEYLVYLPIPHLSNEIKDEFDWEPRIWGNTVLELSRVRNLLHLSFWKRTESDGSTLSFQFTDNFLLVNKKPLDISYDIIEEQGEIWIVSGETRYKILDINQNYMTLHEGRFVFILTKVS
ncbi:MAG: hypothetical protein ACO1N0_12715 [Fluviicola sp.]